MNKTTNFSDILSAIASATPEQIEEIGLAVNERYNELYPPEDETCNCDSCEGTCNMSEEELNAISAKVLKEIVKDSMNEETYSA